VDDPNRLKTRLTREGTSRGKKHKSRGGPYAENKKHSQIGRELGCRNVPTHIGQRGRVKRENEKSGVDTQTAEMKAGKEAQWGRHKEGEEMKREKTSYARTTNTQCK